MPVQLFELTFAWMDDTTLAGERDERRDAQLGKREVKPSEASEQIDEF